MTYHIIQQILAEPLFWARTRWVLRMLTRHRPCSQELTAQWKWQEGKHNYTLGLEDYLVNGASKVVQYATYTTVQGSLG